MAFLISYFFLLSSFISASQFTLSSGFPQVQQGSKLVGESGDASTVGGIFPTSDEPQGKGNESLVLIPRQDEDEDDDDNTVAKNIGNILLGAFSLNPLKVLKGSFGFVDDDLQKHIFDPLLRLPEKWKGTSTTPKTKKTSPRSKLNSNQTSTVAPLAGEGIEKNENGTLSVSSAPSLAANETASSTSSALIGGPVGPIFPATETTTVKVTTTTENDDDEDEENNDNYF